MAPTILTVNTTADQNDGSATNGLSLRDAILIANANPTTEYEIQLAGGTTYNLSSNGINEDAALTGDLDIKSRSNVLYIVAVGGQATINASGLINSDRVFHVLAGGALSLQNVVVTGGKISSSRGGGGIRVDYNGALDLYNTTISGNSAESSYQGGGIYNDGTVYLRNSSINNNKASNGGGILNNGTLIATNSSISSNSSGSGGGIYNFDTLTLINTTVSNNTASSSGGGILGNGSSASIALVNTTISGNSAGTAGGGIYTTGGGVTNILNNTITNNTVSGSLGGGGIYGSVNLKNTIVAGNFNNYNNQGTGKDIQGTVNGNNYNLIGSLAGASGTVGTGTDIVNPNPGLGPLQADGTHALLPGSPAINAGSNSLIPADTEDLDGDGNTTEPIPYDQRGLTRVVGSTVDIGAFEVQSAPLSTLSIKDITVSEGNTGTKNATFTVTLSAASNSVVTVKYATANGTATAGSDYTATTGTLTFNPGDTSKTLNVAVTGDLTAEVYETFFVNLSNAANATIADNQAVGTITNDDGGSGNDTLAGGSGNDTYAFNASTPLGSDTIQETSTGGNDTISFSGTSTDVRLNLGVITTQTVNSNLKLTLSANNVIENIVGGSGSDHLIGNSLNNNLNGGSGNDVLTGRSGADTLIGGAGNDILSGGTESDRFRYSGGGAFTSSNFGVDILTDFTSASDKLVLSKQTFTALTSVVGDGLSQASDFTTVEDDDLAATSTAF
nr:Calx-beta domain-containing protein [Aulosira sp. DedVER01a]